MPRARLFPALRALLITVVLSGCAQIPLGAPQADIANVQALRQADIPPLAVGEFKLAPGKDPGLDKGISVRTNNVHSPINESFAAYLKESLITDLRAAGKLDPSSPRVLSGNLLDSRVEAGSEQGEAVLAARFELSDGGKPAFEKDLGVDARWPSSFVGAIAIPQAVNQYTALYKKLIALLIKDEAFLKAARR